MSVNLEKAQLSFKYLFKNKLIVYKSSNVSVTFAKDPTELPISIQKQANCTICCTWGKITIFYIKACYGPKTVALPLARALLEYPATCNYTRLLTQTTVLDKSGLDCGKFNHIKCNRIPTQRSIQKLFRSNWEKWGDKIPPQATPLWLKPHTRRNKQSSRVSWNWGRNIWIKYRHTTNER